MTYLYPPSPPPGPPSPPSPPPSPSPSPLPQIGMPSRRRLAILGDDITALGLTGTFKSPTSNISQSGWWSQALARLGWPYELVGVSAANGRTVANVLTAFTSDNVAAMNPQEIWIMAGRNDMGSTGAAASALTSMDSLIAACFSINPTMTVRVGSVIPGDATSHTATYQQANAAFNYGLMRRAQSNPNIHFVDVGAALRNPTSATSPAITATFTNATSNPIYAAPAAVISGGHLTPTLYGATLMGNYWANAVSSFAPTNSDDRMFGNNDYYTATVTAPSRMLQFYGTGVNLQSGAAGNGPTSWYLQGSDTGTATGAVITGSSGVMDTSAPYVKQWWDMALSGTSTIATVTTMIASFLPSSGALITPGTTAMRARFDFKCTSLVNVQSFNLQLLNTGVTASVWRDSGVQTLFPSTGTLEIPAFTVPVGATGSWVYQLTILIPGTVSPSGTISIANPVLEIVV